MYTDKQAKDSLSIDADEANLASSKTLKREQLEGTPFWLIEDETGIYICMGRYRLNAEPIYERVKVEAYLIENLYNIVTMIAAIVCKNEIINSNKTK